jgi:hypothetical protein
MEEQANEIANHVFRNSIFKYCKIISGKKNVIDGQRVPIRRQFVRRGIDFEGKI